MVTISWGKEAQRGVKRPMAQFVVHYNLFVLSTLISDVILWNPWILLIIRYCFILLTRIHINNNNHIPKDLHQPYCTYRVCSVTPVFKVAIWHTYRFGSLSELLGVSLSNFNCIIYMLIKMLRQIFNSFHPFI